MTGFGFVKLTPFILRRPIIIEVLEGECALTLALRLRALDLGNRIDIYTSNLDMTVNNYDKIYVAKAEQIVDVWPIMGRSGAAQR